MLAAVNSASPVKLTIVRSGPLPKKAPTGRHARELRMDQFPDHPEYGLTPQRMVQIYRQAEAGSIQQQCDLFDGTVELDAHLLNLFEQRNHAVSGKPWVILAQGPTEQDELAARILQTALRRLPMIELWEHQLSFNKYGFAASEIDWDVLEIDGRDWIVPVHFANVPHRRFTIDKSDQLRLITEENKLHGEPLAPGKWLVTRRSGSKLARTGLLRTAAWLSYFKRNASGDWFVYAQKYGLPLTIVKYLIENDETSKDTAREILANLSEDGGAMIPKDFEVEIKNEGRNGDSSGTHGGLIAWCNAENSKLVNGSTLSNDNSEGGSSYALGDVHDSVRFEAVMYDAEKLQESTRVQLTSLFVRFNGLAAVDPLLGFQVARDATPRQVVEVADYVVNKLRIPVSIAQIRHATSLREPLDAADTAAPAPEPVVPAAGAAA